LVLSRAPNLDSFMEYAHFPLAIKIPVSQKLSPWCTRPLDSRFAVNRRHAALALLALTGTPLLAAAQQPGPPGGWPQQQPGPPAGSSTQQQTQAQNWADQQARNAAMQKAALAQQAQQPVRPQVLQYQRWQKEWTEAHPGEPMPTLGQFEHMHEAEIVQQVHDDGQRMWAARQAKLKADYAQAKQMQAQKNAAQHVTWTSQQWAAWDKAYDNQKRQEANDYLKAQAQAGEELRAEMAEQARREGRAF
jgi:hypothetical protein